MRIVLFVFIAVLVNLPYAHETWTDQRVERDGHEVTAAVLGTRDTGDGYLVDYRLPKSEDPDRSRFSASVDLVTYEHAQDAHEIAVRVVKGEPGSNRPLGLVASSLFRLIAVVSDVVLLVIAAGYAYRRGQRVLR